MQVRLSLEDPSVEVTATETTATSADFASTTDAAMSASLTRVVQALWLHWPTSHERYTTE